MIHDFLMQASKKKMIESGKDNYFTGEKDLLITKEDLNNKINELNDKFSYVLDKEFLTMRINGLISDNVKVGKLFIPNWDYFVIMLNDYWEVCYSPDSAEEYEG